MRLLAIFSLALCLAPAAGCGDDSSTVDMVAAADMSANGTTCLGIITCAMGCSGATTATCAAACAAKGSTKAQTEYNAVYACAFGICLTPGDGGATGCSSMSDQSTGCVDCVVAAAQSTTCSTQLNACLSGT